MKKDRVALLAGFMPPLCMALLMGAEYMIDSGRLQSDLLTAALAETAAFLLPFGILLFLRRLGGEDRSQLRLKRSVGRSKSFVLFISLATPIAAFLLNVLISAVLGQDVGARQGVLALQRSIGGDSIWQGLLVAVVLPAVVEELFFRSALFGCMESAGTSAAILTTAFSFAMVHGSSSNLAGPLLAGLIFGYLCYALGSVWPTVFGHLVSNLYAWGVAYFADVYETFSLWGYFILANVVALCVLLYLAMRSLEKLIERGKIPRFKKGGLEKLVFSFLSPGFLLLVLLFVLKSFYL
ncbi:MAG TPA: CPBP family intramembrane metalloprotease [Candidatus Ventrousia excrementavium]|uniref:CPBP family intramembrane metalloprotease n=1 Tax=Candidatus Ventrousia excrementavium TaxID=2840961 RepID=A0A9D1LLP6_9CLOT|nr:CPBP family intramembrane metalloprotease [Candidatus Ventrousia excrementavium]